MTSPRSHSQLDERVERPLGDVLSLPFDQYQRYRLVAELIERVRSDGARLRILDVGGRTAVLRGFLPEDDITLVDIEASDQEGLVLGSGAALPFASHSFDVVTSFDTLEHVPPQLRDDFVRECARVAQRYCMVAGPYRAPDVDEAEETLKEYLTSKLKIEHRYLNEHRAHGLPVRADVERIFEQAGAQVASIGHANLKRWLVLMCLELYLDQDPGLRPIAERFFRFYNEYLFTSDHAEPVYRHAVLAAFQGAPLPRAEELFGPGQAPPGAFESIAEMGLEVLRFDTEQDVWRPEQERLKGIIEDLEKDLSEHSQALDAHKQDLSELRATYDALLVEHKREQQTLQADLSESKKSIVDFEKVLSDERALYEKAVSEHAEVAATLNADLGEHKKALAGMTANLEDLEREHRRTIVERDEIVGGLDREIRKLLRRVHKLERDLGKSRRYTGTIEANLQAAKQTTTELNSHLVDREAQLAIARSRLRSRFDAIKRLFGKKPRSGL